MPRMYRFASQHRSVAAACPIASLAWGVRDGLAFRRYMHPPQWEQCSDGVHAMPRVYRSLPEGLAAGGGDAPRQGPMGLEQIVPAG